MEYINRSQMYEYQGRAVWEYIIRILFAVFRTTRSKSYKEFRKKTQAEGPYLCNFLSPYL
jgi:hypothetical protein